MSKKALVITGLNEKLYPLFPLITNKKTEELMIINNYGAVISQPYGCTIRNIIMAVFHEDVDEIYIIGEMNNNENLLKEDEWYSKFQEAGITKKTIQTIEYIDVIGNDVLKWLGAPQDSKMMIQKNIDLIQRHPLIPKTVSVYGFIANAETSEFEAVS